ncbi:MAG: T9SS type B sorting domain-containing protein [Flavobacteriales bacterium]
MRSVVASCLLVCSAAGLAQNNPLPTMGREFWLGYMRNAYNAQNLRVTITSNVATSGTVSVPLQGWSAPFTVTAGGITTVTVPNTAENTVGDVVGNKGVLVSSVDSVTVYATNFQNFSLDATQVLPVGSLGLNYRVDAGPGLPNFNDFYKSELLIVATEDATQVTIKPSVATDGGHPAGAPYTVNLNAGETYQVMSASELTDLTGTTVSGTALNGPCRPFAVFGGSMCANVPTGCPACDHIFEQCFPLETWGTDHHTIPLTGMASYTYRVLADQNATSVTVDGGAPILLNAGQSFTLNGATQPVCIHADKPISSVEIFEGFNCSGAGDPSSLNLVPQDRLSYAGRWSTITSGQITQHRIAVVMPASGIGQLQLDGSTVSPGTFSPYSACNTWVKGSIIVTPGAHRLQSATGFIAYAYGFGMGESYAFNIGDRSTPTQPVDTVICATGQVNLQGPPGMSNYTWTLASDPGNILATTQNFAYVPTSSDTVLCTGTILPSNCQVTASFLVEAVAQPPLTLTASNTNGCTLQPIQLTATLPNPISALWSWSPAGLLNDATISNPIATVQQSTWFVVEVNTPFGCDGFKDSILVDVDPGNVISFDIHTADSILCSGDQVPMQVDVEAVIARDGFNSAPATFWSSIQGGAPASTCGSITGNALFFDGAGTRAATTNALDVSTGGSVHFALKIANGTAPCDDADPGEDVVLQYSTNGGGSWNNGATFTESGYPLFSPVVVPITGGMQSANTMFRLKQVSSSGIGQDVWAIDQFLISTWDNTVLDYLWSPAASVSNPTAIEPLAWPTSTGHVKVDATDPLTQCVYSDSVLFTVGSQFSLNVTDDTTLCAAAPVQLNAVPSAGSNHSYNWTPNNGTLSSTTSASPVATPTSTTTYNISATTPEGCTASGNITITVGNMSNLVVSTNDNQVCIGQQVQLNAAVTGGANLQYAWSPAASLNNATIANPVATLPGTTTYSVTVTDGLSGCTLSGGVTITTNAPYVLNATPSATVCSALGLQLTVAHNVPAPQYVWAPAANLNAGNIQSPTIMADTSAIYVVTITDANGCSATDTTHITVAFDDLVQPPDTAICQGQSIVLNAGYPGNDFLWSTNATTQSITVNSTNNYVVTITDAMGCEAVRAFDVVVNPLPIVNLGPDLALCGAASQVLNANSPGSAVLWSTNAVTQQISVSATNDYWLQVTNTNGCVNSDTLHVAFNANPVDNLQDVAQCSTQPVVLDAGNPGSTYAWSTNAVTQSITVNTSATYSVGVTTPQNCTSTFDAVVNFVQPPVVDIGNDTLLCVGQPLLLDAGNTGATFLWNTNANTQTIAPTTSGTYWVDVSNAACTTRDSIDVTFQALPTDNLQDVTACITDVVTLDAGNAGCTYLWSTNAATQTILPTTSNTYSVTVTNAANCSATFSSVVTFVGYPVVNLGPDTVLCEGQVLVLDAGNVGANFTWSNGGAGQTIAVSTSNSYSVAVNNGYCTSNDAINVHFNPSPASMATHQFFICLDEAPHHQPIDAGNPGSGFVWSTGDTNQVTLAGAYGWYFVTVTNNFDCSATDSAVVNEFCPATIYVPNTFTPNGDGVNDLFMPVGKNIAELSMRVFDRYGNVLWETDAPDVGWDGTVGGVMLPNEVYVWRMTYRFLQDTDGTLGREISQMGHVTILR